MHWVFPVGHMERGVVNKIMDKDTIDILENLAQFIIDNPKDWKDKVAVMLEEGGVDNLIGQDNKICMLDGFLLMIPGKGPKIIDCINRLRLGREIKKVRESRRLSLRELAKLSGVSHQNILKLENGRYNPSLDILNKILDPLGLEVGLRYVSTGEPLEIDDRY